MDHEKQFVQVGLVSDRVKHMLMECIFDKTDDFKQKNHTITGRSQKTGH